MGPEGAKALAQVEPCRRVRCACAVGHQHLPARSEVLLGLRRNRNIHTRRHNPMFASPPSLVWDDRWYGNGIRLWHLRMESGSLQAGLGFVRR
jgi:hypothetical protein